ncbi:outer membrane protein [Bradyrhizobium sp.]|uniref:outer membrane protein n=1 Tax=Bradyrhizobium sp. TaxID=376 RepID=UPI003C597D83
MKKILLGAIGLLALGAAPAVAADLPARTYTKAPPMMAAIYDWSGFYVGVNGGGASSHNCWTNTAVPAATEGCHNATGGLVGGQIGYRWQMTNWVFGVEAQGDWADLKGSNASVLPPTLTNQTKIDAIGLFTGQVGYAWNNVLWYVKGGAAVTDAKYNGITATGLAFDQATETRWGGAVGTGVEVSFAPSWSVGLEYDHLFMGNRTLNFTGIGTGAFTRSDTVQQDVDMGSVHVNYRWGGPVVAKY